MSPDLLSELDRLAQRNQRFTELLNEITQLTHQLERRYRGILPFSVETTPVQRITTRLHLRRDPGESAVAAQRPLRTEDVRAAAGAAQDA